jgi:hypothetical protein
MSQIYSSGLKTLLIPRQEPQETYVLKLDQDTNPDGQIMISKLNEELYDLTIIKNSKLLDGYKRTIQYLMNKKKEDIKEIHQYIMQKNAEVVQYQDKIKELTSNQPEITTVVEEKDPGDMECSIEQLLRKQLERTNLEFELEVISPTRPFTLMLTIEQIQILIEITSTSKNTNDAMINSFRARTKSSSAQGGLFISMENSYTIKSGISDFSVSHEEDKYLLFISNLEKDHFKFKNAINILIRLVKK